MAEIRLKITNPNLLAKIDKARGKKSRTSFITTMLEKELADFNNEGKLDALVRMNILAIRENTDVLNVLIDKMQIR